MTAPKLKVVGRTHLWSVGIPDEFEISLSLGNLFRGSLQILEQHLRYFGALISLGPQLTGFLL